MKKNVQIIGIILVLAVAVGLIAMLFGGSDDTKKTSTPTKTVEQPTPATEGAEASPTQEMTDDNNATNTPVPTEPVSQLTIEVVPTTEVSPSAAPTPTTTGSLDTSGMTEEQKKAVELLAGVSADELGLTKDISECVVFFDEWTTNVGSVECYNVNVGYQENTIAAIFYVAKDYSAIFYAVEDGIFEEIEMD